MKNKKILIIVSIVLVLIIILGSSYAYLRVEKKGGAQNISIANFGLVIKEDMKAITLDNEVPKTDQEGLKNTPNTFVIKNEGAVTAKYKVSLIDSTTIQSTMSNLDVRYQLTRTRSTNGKEEVLEINNLDGNGLMDEGTIAPSEEISYKLIIWIDYDANPNGLKYSKVLSLEGLQADTLDASGANPPEMLSNMIPVYYDKQSDTEGVWRVADITNQNPNYKWYDYNDFMWANAVTVKNEKKAMEDITHTNVTDSSIRYNYLLDNEGNAYFDGIDDYYTLEHLTDEDFPNNQITLVTRVKVHSYSSAYQDILSSQQSGGGRLYYDVDHHFRFQYYIGAENQTVVSSKTYELNTWYTLVGTYDGNQMIIYIDGEKVNSLNVTGNLKDSVAPFIIGGNPGANGMVESETANITVSNAMVYNKALSQEDIMTYFKGVITNAPTDGILINKNKFEEPKSYTLSDFYQITDDGEIYLDGKDDYLNLGHPNETFTNNTISMIARVKFHKKDVIQEFFGNWQSGGGGMAVSIENILYFNYYIGGAYHSVYSDISIELEKWYTIVGTYDGSKMRIYVNGGSPNELELSGDIKTAPVPFMLGGNAAITNFPSQSMSNVTISTAMVYNDVITSEEVEKYFKGEVIDYPKDNMVVGYNVFKNKSERDVFLDAKPGVEIPMESITSMWVWIPRYKYTIFNGNNETANEQMINVQFEHGIETTGTVSCKDNILTDDDSASSEECTDTTNNGIKNGVSTYTHPAFTFGSDELVGFWMSKFEISTDNTECLTNQVNSCNKAGMNILIKPNQVSLRYIDNSHKFMNLRSMELYGNIHGFPQSKEATSYLDAKGNLSGEIPNDSNNYDIHMMKNMEWGAVTYLTMSKYGKYGNSLYKDDYRRVYLNNYYENKNGTYIYKTGYSGKKPEVLSDTSGALYNNLTIENDGQGYIGAGASTTGTVYGIYDMSGGANENVMALSVDKNKNLQIGSSGTWTSTNKPLDKYYDLYSYTNAISNDSNNTDIQKNTITRGKLGDATKEIMKKFEVSTGGWEDSASHSWIAMMARGGSAGYSGKGQGLFFFYNSSTSYNGNAYRATSRPVLAISREIPWKNN